MVRTGASPAYPVDLKVHPTALEGNDAWGLVDVAGSPAHLVDLKVHPTGLRRALRLRFPAQA
ncbi:hypothetical protein SAMN04488052_11232 [Aquisalimonas asiatica]|uniref:Uncharacterized protein n=2 Tax=Aquisalimonas asiatica TaxID=406100 RepID=A0A1H8VFZ6_9GAMM|nr:hypothetical protein SAMN04488052_11232 [Aquisalimonas asiatica]